MTRKCCVVGCESVYYVRCGVSFHGFPKSNYKEKWMNALTTDVISELSVVCSLHFKREDFLTSSVTGKLKLKYSAVPSQVQKMAETEQSNSEHIQVKLEPIELAEASSINQLNKIKNEPSDIKSKIEIEVTPIESAILELKNESVEPDSVMTDQAEREVAEGDLHAPLSQSQLSQPIENTANSEGAPLPSADAIWQSYNKLFKIDEDDTVTTVKRFACNLCQFQTSHRGNFTMHYRTHSRETEFPCQVCGFKTTRKETLSKHMRIHTGEKPYECTVCDYKTARKETLTLHLRTHTGEKPYSCQYCQYKTSRKGTLQLHMRIHTGEKPLMCTHCDYRTSQKRLLLGHMRTTHTGEKPFACQMCDYKTVRREYLKCHMLTHTGNKRFSCEFCQFQTLRKGSLMRHIQTHTGEKPFVCNICDYKTAEKKDLVMHERVHSGEKPFSCEPCDYRTSRRTCLVRHMRTIHGDDIAKRKPQTKKDYNELSQKTSDS